MKALLMIMVDKYKKMRNWYIRLKYWNPLLQHQNLDKHLHQTILFFILKIKIINQKMNNIFIEVRPIKNGNIIMLTKKDFMELLHNFQNI